MTDTVAFVQEWMMSGDHEPSQWDRDFAAAIDARCKAASEDGATGLPLDRMIDAITVDLLEGQRGNEDTYAWVRRIARAALAASPTDATGAEMREAAAKVADEVAAAEEEAGEGGGREWSCALHIAKRIRNLPVAGETL